MAINLSQEIEVPVEYFGQVVVGIFPPPKSEAMRQAMIECAVDRWWRLFAMAADKDRVREYQQEKERFFDLTCLRIEGLTDTDDDGTEKPIHECSAWQQRVPEDIKWAMAGQFEDRARLSGQEKKNLNGQLTPAVS